MTTTQQRAQIWWTANLIASVLQTCFFTAWVAVLLALLDAPFWAWVIGSVYALSHWISYLTWFVSNMSLKQWKDEEKEKSK